MIYAVGPCLRKAADLSAGKIKETTIIITYRGTTIHLCFACFISFWCCRGTGHLCAVVSLLYLFNRRIMGPLWLWCHASCHISSTRNSLHLWKKNHNFSYPRDFKSFSILHDCRLLTIKIHVSNLLRSKIFSIIEGHPDYNITCDKKFIYHTGIFLKNIHFFD